MCVNTKDDMKLQWSDLLNNDFDILKKSIANPLEKVIKLKKGERRDVAILFMDLKGFTAMSTELDAEELVDIIQNAFVMFTKIIEKYYGYVDKYEGDAIMAIFGGKKATEKDTENAIRAGLEMIEKLQQINELLKPQSLSLSMRIGVNFGSVVTAKIGTGESADETVYGDAVNLASRLEGLAPTGKILITEATKKIVDAIFDFEFNSHQLIKGLKEKINLYTVKNLKDVELKRWERSALARKNVFIGRYAEAEKISTFYDECKNSGKFEGKHFLTNIIGPAGIGKSRFIYEFLKQFKKRHKDIKYIYSQTASFYPPSFYIFSDMLERFFQLKNQEQIPMYRMEKFESSLNELKTEDNTEILTEIKPMLGYLLGLKYTDDRFKYLDGKQIIAEIQIALTKFLQIISNREMNPMVVIFEDLHWIDELSLNTLKFIIENLDTELPIFFILIYRDEFQLPPEIKEITFCQQVALHHFSSDESKMMINSLLPKIELTNEFIYNLLQKSNGNPFYLEEFIQLMLDKEYIVMEKGKYKIQYNLDDLEIPDSLKSIILSRIDHLSNEVKTTLKNASIIGYEFLYKILQFIHQNIEPSSCQKLEEYLNIIEQLDYVLKKESIANITYIFKHILTQQTVYSIILHHNRKILHRLTGQALEEIFQNEIEHHYNEIANHYYLSDNPDKAKYYLKKAIDDEMQKYYNEQALKHIEMFIELSDNQKDTLEYSLKKGIIYNNIGKWQDAEQTYLNLVDKLQGLDFPLLYADTLQCLGKLYVNQSKYDEGEKILNNAYKIFCKLKDVEGILKTMRNFGTIYLSTQDYEKAKEVYESALKIAKDNGINDEIGKLSVNIGIIYEKLGDYQKAEYYYNQANEMNRLTDNKLGQSKRIGNIANLLLMKNELSEAEKFYKKQLQLCDEIKFREGMIISAGNLATCLLYQDKENEAIEFYNESLKSAKDTGDKLGMSFALTNLADIYKCNKEHNKALELSEKNLELAKEVKDYEGLAITYGNIGDIYKEQDNLDKSEQFYKQAIDIAEKHKIDYYLCSFQYGLACLYFKMDRFGQAKEWNEIALNNAQKMRRDDVVKGVIILKKELENR